MEEKIRIDKNTQGTEGKKRVQKKNQLREEMKF